MRVRIVPEYPGLVISEDGRVQGPTKVWAGPKPDAAGYSRVSLWRNGRRELIRTHVVVCTAFHGSRPTPAHQVAHGNGDPRDNRAGNLRWATPSENNLDCSTHGRHAGGGGLRMPWERVQELRKGWTEGAWETYAEAAGYFGVSRQTISRIVRLRTRRNS